MHTLGRGASLTLLAGAILLLGQGPVRTQDKASTIDFKVVPYDGLAEEIVRQRGKVVLVDFWAQY